MTTLYSYRIPFDAGSAPNPYWGVCTLVICKPSIRRTAKLGDWIVGIGSKNSPIDDISSHVVYAMKVTEKLTMAQYDAFAREQLRQKIPDWRSRDIRRRLGDAIYDFGVDPPRVRRSVHDEGQRARDLSGRYALLSQHFYYFGDHPRSLPSELRALARVSRGHRSRSNDSLVAPFLAWLRSLRLKRNGLYGSPQRWLFPESTDRGNDCSDSGRC